MWRGKAVAWLVIGRQGAELAVADSPAGPVSASRSARFATPDPSTPELTTGIAMLQAVDRLLLDAQAMDADRLRGSQLMVVVSSPWAHTTSLPWSDALADQISAKAYASQQLRAAGFDVAPGDRLVVEDAPYRQARLAVAYPADLLARVEDFASRAGLTVQSIVTLPMVAAAWARNKTGDSTGVMALVEGDVASILRWSGRSMAPVGGESPLTTSGNAAVELKRLWRRHQLRDASLGSAGTALFVLDLRAGHEHAATASVEGLQELALPPMSLDSNETPTMRLARTGAALSSTLDATLRRSGVSRKAACVAVTAALVASVAVYKAAQSGAAVREAEALLARSSQATPPPRPAITNREGLARITSVNAAITALNLPISDLLHALQPPKGLKVGLLAIEIQPPRSGPESNGAGAVVKLSGEAASESEMARYVTYVATRRPYTEAYLTSHEMNDATPSRRYRFSAEALWQP